MKLPEFVVNNRGFVCKIQLNLLINVYVLKHNDILLLFE